MEKKKKIILGAGAVILAGAVGASVYFLQKDGEGENETLAYVTSVASMNDAVGAQKMAGVVESQKTQEIQKDSERQVKEILVKAGDEHRCLPMRPRLWRQSCSRHSWTWSGPTMRWQI